MISQKTFHVTAYVSLVTVTRNGFAMGKTSTDRQKDLRAKRKAAGLAQMSIWAKATDKELLRDIERRALAGESAADVLRERLQLRPEIREIVKTVEKRVEVPVEKIVERRVEVPVEVEEIVERTVERRVRFIPPELSDAASVLKGGGWRARILRFLATTLR